jgi:acetolactate synthase-1/3 small subunit
MLRIFVAITDNEPGVLDRIASTFRRRGFNIYSLTVSPTTEPGVSRTTLVTEMDAVTARSAKAFLERLVNVHSVVDLTDTSPIVRDLALIRVASTPETRQQLFQLAHLFHADVVDVASENMVLSAYSSPEQLDAFVESVRPFGILEIGRTGAVAMHRSAAIPATTNAHTEVGAHAVSF